MSAPIVVRSALDADLPQLAALFERYRRFYEQPPDEALALHFMQERMQRADSTILVALRSADVLAGFTQLYPTLCSVAAAPIYVLYDLYVAEDARRQGVGRALLEAARRHAAQAGAARMELATATSNAAAQRLYEALGWMRDDQFHRYSLPLR
jgi:ribosomal protein S18 acetylase RimI-like enzyme